MIRELIAVLDHQVVARITQGHDGRFALTYDASWRSSDRAFPLSVSMPLVRDRHDHATVEAFLMGLLPDREDVRRKWAAEFGVAANNPVALLSHVGGDCAGALRLVPPDQLEQALRPGIWDVERIEDAEIAERLREMGKDPAAWRRPTDVGRFSLSGAQSKMALMQRGGMWGIPTGDAPTTHILKPAIPGYDGHVQNEHLCMTLATELGLNVAATQVHTFEDQTALVVERYDRAPDPDQLHGGPNIRRIHQEDMCQALGIHPSLKYQNDGGPGPPEIVQLLREQSNRPVEDVGRFLSALGLNWILAGTDAHARNYSLILDHAGSVRLAPLYDIASALPYDDWDERRDKGAMKIGSTYRLSEINAHQWRSLAKACDVRESHVFAALNDLVLRLPEALELSVQRLRREGVQHPVLRPLILALRDRAQTCARILAAK